MKISLIISTYNRPEALRLSLMSVKVQIRIPDEVIIADDGSKESTRKLIKDFATKFPCPLLHAWQEDKGFRLAEMAISSWSVTLLQTMSAKLKRVILL